MALVIVLLVSIVPAQVNVGQGSYTNSGSYTVPDVSPRITSEFTQHAISNKWWVTLISEQYSGDLYGHPLGTRATASGLSIGYPGTPPSNFMASLNADLSVGIANMSASAANVARYGHFSVTARWEDGSNIMEATIGSGFNFVYFTMQGGGAAQVNTLSTGNVWFNDGSVIGITISGHHYGIFGPTGSTWSGTQNFSNTLDGKGYMSVALLPDGSEETLNAYREYAYAHVVNTTVTWNYNEAKATLVSNFNFITEAKEGITQGTIFSMFRHQWPEAVTPFLPYTYQSPRGEMKTGEGTTMTTAMIFNGVTPALPYYGHDQNTLNDFLNDQNVNANASSTYAKPLGELAQLVEIANLNGNTQARDAFVNELKQELERWLSTGDSREFYYHEPWSRLIGYPASFGSESRLADHHFHYGYFLQAAAAIAKFDKQWASESNWGGMVQMLIRDINTWDEADPLFGRWAYFEPYEGHGWADGLGFGNGNNQESSSESMNFNAGLILWGMNTGNKQLRDLGIFMYVMESRAIEQYWFDVDQAVFPSGYDHEVVGMLWSNGGAYATWFSSSIGAIHGINILPITAASQYYARQPADIQRNFNEGSGVQWQDLFVEYLAYADPAQANQLYEGGTSLESGNSRSYYYYHIKSLNAVGTLNIELTASIPGFNVFDNAGIRTYTAYNPDAAPVTVLFNDGYNMTVPAVTQLSQQGPVLPLTGANKHIIKNAEAQNLMGPLISLNKIQALIDEGGVKKVDIYGVDGKLLFTWLAGFGTYLNQVTLQGIVWVKVTR